LQSDTQLEPNKIKAPTWR